jgi:ATP-binding cassette, subfamily B, multidrug efflux pump
MFIDGGRSMLDQEVAKPRNIRTTLGNFWAYFRKYWVGVLVTAALVVIGVGTQVIAPEYIGQAVDCYLFPQPNQPDACWFEPGLASDASSEAKIAGLGQLALVLMGIYVVSSVANGLSFYAVSWTAQNVMRKLRQDLFTQVHRLSLGFYAKSEAGDVMSRVTNDIDTVQQAFGFALIGVLSGLLLIGWTIIRMLQVNVPYALVSLIVFPLMGITTWYFSSQARKAFRKARKEIGAVNADLQESISGAREVQAFAREQENLEQFQVSNDANRTANIRASVFTSALRPVLEALGYVALAIVVVAGGLSVLRNEPFLGTSVLTLGTVFVFVNYVQQLNRPILQIAVQWANVQSGIAGGERIFSFLEEQPDLMDASDAATAPQFAGDVRFDDVSLAYVGDELVLKDISFKVSAGQTVALVGPTGAGKSSIVNLIPRFFDVRSGAVRIDEQDLRSFTRDSLRKQIGVVLQDTFLFSDTVMENIRYGRIDATDEEVMEAARLAVAHEFIERLPEGYQTVLGERGSGLSQGQRQLIAIARVALMNPAVLILDEATSSVDTRTEKMIQAAFDVIMRGRTSFVIAHRLSTIRNADVVMLVSDGQIAERGTHQELMAHEGAYYDLYMSQFSNEQEAIAV